MKKIHWRTLPGPVLTSDKALQAHWDRLNAERLDVPFLSSYAIAAALAAFGGERTKLLVADEGAEPVAMFLLEAADTWRWSTFQPSQLPLGAWVARADLRLAPLCRDLLRSLPWSVMRLLVSQVDPRQEAQADEAPDIELASYIDTAWLDIAGTFDDYWAARGKNLRQNLRKQRNRLASEGTQTTMRILRSPQEMAEAVARYGALESTGWKSTEGTAIHPGNEQGRFYVQLLEEAARRDEAMVFEYLIDGRTAAMNLGICRGGVLVVLKTTYDESLPKSLSPASLLREDELKHFFAQPDIRRLEYYGRVMDWHTKLTENRRTLYHLTAYRWPLLKTLAQRRRAAAPAAATTPPSERAEEGALAHT
ncbi:MAG: GNAT family N-acetyltransferase [Burkholderiaceae bacterium]|nr:GNAT family N-acetyltransferase [Burkholderiaceae bacterium]